MSSSDAPISLRSLSPGYRPTLRKYHSKDRPRGQGIRPNSLPPPKPPVSFADPRDSPSVVVSQPTPHEADSNTPQNDTGNPSHETPDHSYHDPEQRVEGEHGTSALGNGFPQSGFAEVDNGDDADLDCASSAPKDPDAASMISNASGFTEKTSIPRRNLRTQDVAALILNKQIGTGIFTTPGLVLSLTRNKPLSIGLWTVGGVHAFLCMFIYLEYGTALPFTGGELIYLDEVFHLPELLATVLFSGFFICLGNTAGNSIAFAKHVLLAANPTADRITELDGRLVSFVAVSILTVVCLLHHFSQHMGLFLNRAFALYKIALLFAFFVAGVAARNKKPSGKSGFDTMHAGGNKGDSLAALVYILYSYQGWENANYVAGEIKAPKKTLRRGAFFAIGIVTVLYVLVTVGLYLALDYETITSKNNDLGVALNFAPKAFGSTTGIKICIALSAVGNLIAVIYTSAKVKQAIAIQRIIPFYKFLQKDDRSPTGGLVLHWVSSLIIVCATPNNSDGYGFVVGLFTYGHIIIGVFIGLGFYRLRARMQTRRTPWRPSYLRSKLLSIPLPLLFVAMNLLILAQGARPHSPGTIARFWWPAVTGFIFAGSFVYWCGLTLLQAKIPFTGVTVGEVVGFKVIVRYENDEDIPNDFQRVLAQARNDGSRRRVEYQMNGLTEFICNKFKIAGNLFSKYFW